MRLGSRAFATVAFSAVVLACGDHDGHSHDKRLYPQTQLTPPSRPLVWGDVNIIHTTDSHGWLLGHQKKSFPEPNYSGDLGDFSSFVTHMKEIALQKGVDLLLVDSGDLHDGTGLSDGYPPGGVDGHASNQFLKQLPYDIMTIGNHELYVYNDTLDMYENFAPALHGRYLSSNVNITVNGTSVPVGSRYAKFKTLYGRSVTALGVLYDFTGNDYNTTVQMVEDMVQEQWFNETIAEEPDFFLLVGHMPVAEDKWPVVFDAVRAVHPTTPIIILGGHTHIRNCLQMDGRSMSLESGRYMETVGWMSVELPQHDTDQNLTFTRRYLDPNRVTYEYHTQTSNHTFDTVHGRNITAGLLALWDEFDLSYTYGTAPMDYLLTRVPYPSNDSLPTFLVAEAAPYALGVNNTRADIPNLIITNSGSLRFDLYAGVFDKNDQLTSSPFTDSFLYIPEVPYSAASQVLDMINDGSYEVRRKRDERYQDRARADETYYYGRGFVQDRYTAWLRRMDILHGGPARRSQSNLTLGYVTTDACPGIGDDTPHAPLASYDVPDYIQSNAPANVTNDTLIDFVFVDFIEDEVLDVLNAVGNVTYTSSDVSLYSDVLADAILGVYAEAAWN
ncbi:hypothetical protein FISHEDRAFT_36991 [Fistulina hepatica ATCC 64428]|uniref:Calcineurin-like phosphoesterase domain-containing protein n=1 Tax=Fistulina hepatica ATCC 64428 TaxID=1128425 RepID=A0A0D7AHX2_9AGAR|nr:hypothetical protein FISHEDRAFT_36991 [Fistulina hepatica ATCC 64428]